MKVSAIFTMVALCICSGCSNAQTVSGNKILIVYLSRTSNTKAVAEMIHKNIGGDLAALELVNPYPDDYKETVAQVEEENETGFLPPLKTKIDSIEKYNTVFIGFPTWGMQLPPPMKSFLAQYDMQGKTIIPFNTNAGYGVGNAIETIKKLCPKSEIAEMYSVTAGKEKDGILYVMKGQKAVQVQSEVKRWLNKLGFNNM